jgi:hypothetical protein
VRKFENDSWQYVGNMLYVDTIFISASMAFDSNNIPYLAYKDFSNSSVIMVKKLENGIWQNVGTGAVSSNWSGGCVLVFDNNDVPYLFYAEGSDSGKATVKKFENDSWQVVGQTGFSTGQISSISMVIDDNNVPYVAYSDEGNVNSIYVKKFENSNWSAVGDEAGIPIVPYLNQNALFIGSNNTPYIAYKLYVASPPYVSEIVFKKYINNEWQQAGELILEVQGVGVSFGLYNDIPYMAYTNDENENNTVIRFENDNWQAVGEEGFSEGMAAARLTINNNGIPYVAFINYTNGYRITVMKYDSTMSVDTHTHSNILLYPNPANDVVTIDNIPDNSIINIYDITGKLVYTSQTDTQTVINIADFANGIYLVQLVSNNQQQTVKKLVINR